MLGPTFRSLTGFNYRLWAAGALVSNVGTWMQRTGQDCIVFTELTPNDAAAVGFTMALQFGPSLFLLPFAGYMADHPTELYYRDAKQLTIVEGTTQVQRGLIARGVLDHDLWWD